MDWDQLLKANGLDRYDRNARLYPALLCLLPIFAVVALWLPQVWTLLGGLVALAAACGLIFFLAQLVRYFGRQVEKKLGERVGRAHSAVLLSHSDARIASGTKARYHRYLAKHGIKVPNARAEADDPAAAKHGFRSAIDWLLVHTRPQAKASMLLNENIACGFRRNLLGVKPVALALLVLALLGNLYLLLVDDDQAQAAAAGVVELLLLLALTAWLFVVRANFVEDASLAYAQRLFDLCDDAQAAPRQESGPSPERPATA